MEPWLRANKDFENLYHCYLLKSYKCVFCCLKVQIKMETMKTRGDRSGAALGENTSTTLDHLLYESGYNR